MEGRMKLYLSGTAFLALMLTIVTTHHAFAGTPTAYDFLRADVGSRAAGMAGSFVSITGDPNTIFYNPAGLSTLEKPMGSLGFFKHLMDINAGYVAYSQEFGDLGYFGVGALYVNYGSFNETDDLGNVLGTFSASDMAFTLGYSNIMKENLHYGINAKFIYSSIAGYNSTGAAADFGILYAVPESRFSFGASIRNVGRQFSSYIESKEKLPLDVVVGASVVPRGLPLLININFHKLNEDVDTFGDRFKSFSVGGEFTLSQVIMARFGYNNEQRRELKIGAGAGLAGFSGGIGVTVKEYKVDYALSSLGKIGAFHRISIGTSF